MILTTRAPALRAVANASARGSGLLSVKARSSDKARTGVAAEARSTRSAATATHATTRMTPLAGRFMNPPNTRQPPPMRRTTRRVLTYTGRPTRGGSLAVPLARVQVGSTIA